MEHLKMSGDLYDDVKKVDKVICYLQDMVNILEKECIERDNNKNQTTGLYIHIYVLKIEITKLVNESERMLWKADTDQFGSLSKYARPYLGF